MFIAVLAGLSAAGCQGVRVETNGDGWHEDKDGEFARQRTGDVEEVVRLDGPDGEYPVETTFFNHGETPLPMTIAPQYECADDFVIGEILPPSTATETVAPVPFTRTDELTIPACVGGAPGELRVALRRNERKDRDLVLNDYRYADATYEAHVRTPDGEMKAPMTFRVAHLVCGSQTVSTVCDGVLLVVEIPILVYVLVTSPESDT
jgi:hypothetical protein